MAEYIELIDKYLVTRGDSGTPSYSWTDTTGEIVRCKDCVHYDLAKNGYNGNCTRQYAVFTAYDFCSYGERRGDTE